MEFSQKYLYFELLDQNELKMTHIWADASAVEVNIFNANENDFYCVDGFIEFPVTKMHGQIEGTTVNGQARKRLKKASDGSLIIISTFGPYRSRSENALSDFTHEFYRFVPFESSELVERQ